jgi:hypothetical protein
VGLVLSARCPCGIDTEVFVGSGMHGPSTACLPAWCTSCKQLVTAPTQKGKPRCERCRTPVEVICLYDPAGLRETPPEEPVPCPSCRATSLRFTFSGVWD